MKNTSTLTKALVENENTSALINIALEDDSNTFELLQNLEINNL